MISICRFADAVAQVRATGNNPMERRLVLGSADDDLA
jgi:hypothetical protein